MQSRWMGIEDDESGGVNNIISILESLEKLRS